MTPFKPKDIVSYKPVANRRKQRGGLLRSLTRISVGATLLAIDAVTSHLQEAERNTLLTPPSESRKAAHLVIEAEPDNNTLPQPPEPLLRHAVIGLLFDSQTRFWQKQEQWQTTGREASQTASRFLRPLISRRIFAPVRNRVEATITKGQNKVAEWSALGRIEETYSRALAETTLNQVVDSALDHVTENPRIQEFVQEFVQEQSVGMAGEVLEEVRERTVTGDILLERFARKLLGRPPRNHKIKT